MPLEAVVVCLDNSEFNRNGDFAPSRWESQQDAASNICEVKLNQNPENTLGIMTCAGARVDVLLTQSNDTDAILAAITNAEINGKGQFFNAVKVAQLSLKHRMNKQQKQRVIVFVGHPLIESYEQCEDLGKRLKRNNVAVDIINFANAENVPKLEALVQAANNSSNSHFMDVPIGCTMITDLLFTSPILGNEDGPPMGGEFGGAGAMGAPGDRFAEYGGINPQLDPDLAMALKVSLEEERNRANQTNGKDEGKGGIDAGVVSGVPVATDGPMETQMGAPMDPNEPEVAMGQPVGAEEDDDQYDEQYYLEQAIKMSLQVDEE